MWNYIERCVQKSSCIEFWKITTIIFPLSFQSLKGRCLISGVILYLENLDEQNKRNVWRILCHMTKNFLVRKDSKVLKYCLKMCQCVCVCVCACACMHMCAQQRETCYTLLSTYYPSHASSMCAPAHTHARTRAHTHTHTRGLKFFIFLWTAIIWNILSLPLPFRARSLH
jgi:hypothetical protein